MDSKNELLKIDRNGKWAQETLSKAAQLLVSIAETMDSPRLLTLAGALGTIATGEACAPEPCLHLPGNSHDSAAKAPILCEECANAYIKYAPFVLPITAIVQLRDTRERRYIVLRFGNFWNPYILGFTDDIAGCNAVIDNLPDEDAIELFTALTANGRKNDNGLMN